MSVERVYHCDWRECEGHAGSTDDAVPSSFITVTEEGDHFQHFCCWDCLLKFAGEKPPTQTILVAEPL
jgi:hypothetical protein